VKKIGEDVTKTTLRNAERQKLNNEARARLLAQQLEIRSRAVIAGLKNKAAAASCLRAVYDGADPKLCDIGLMCQAFERGGMFRKRLPSNSEQLR